MPEYQSLNYRIETEEVLGPLPTHWEKAPWGKSGRFYFVDHSNKSTTWVDPRTHDIRKHNINDVVPGELPYAWEEAFDEVCGTYFIDHLTQNHFLDGPWEEHIKNQVLEMQGLPMDENTKLDEQLALEKQKKAELDEAEGRLVSLEAEKCRIEEELRLLQEKMDEPENSENLESLQQEEDHLKEGLETLLIQLEQERQETERIRREHSDIEREIAAFQLRLQELQRVNERLESENREFQGHNDETNQNITEMREMIELEAEQRTALEAYIKQLKLEVLQLANPEEADRLKMEEESKENDVENAPLPPTGVMSPEEEMRALKIRLDDEKVEMERLKRLGESLESERTKVQETGDVEVPDWIKELNLTAEGTTVRVKKTKNLDANGAEVETVNGDAVVQQSVSDLPEKASEVPAEEQEVPSTDQEVPNYEAVPSFD
ncbi:Membrane-associated guanylate kinase, WW and PDZ domain-containing protein 2 [Clydaea vesicula]|uniref:Membrane-associated guanylate kinase, WW and PDZ domain-containing protein 2 n=1 Tax=Clydaea vesicula TaxID=447962 RepID=A0AAD5XX20_9FUNG|nr:Membrane-associated guanylate kinase, WW and PDZ domain-containing protein 2 [Clydaea vesicula]KAJ3381600.1 Membrane-associated guanylate kinase, WW and PDZ domain-containing protein 2 [Lobulomyces angularis]